MAIEATYALNNYLNTFVAAIDTFVFYPGDFAPESLGKALILYNVTPNAPYELFMINSDVVRYRVIHTDYEKMQKAVTAIQHAVNPYYTTVGLFSGTTDDSKTIVPVHLWAAAATPGHDFFPDSVQFFYTNLSVQYTYKLV